MDSNKQNLQEVNITNLNREFRKIKSSKFLYEINASGTIVRNIKSKKQLKIVRTEKGYYVQHKDQLYSIASLIAECWLEDNPDEYEIDHIDRNIYNNQYTNLRYIKNKQMRMKPVKIINTLTGQSNIFESFAACSSFLSKELNINTESIRQRLKKKRSHIYHYDIIFLNAETASGHSTE